MIRVFIGFDPRETVAYHVCSQSILSRSSSPLAITPIYLENIKKIFDRPREQQSTDFAFSRFLVPYLSGYKGFSIFMDCDMLVRCDITELLQYASTDHDVCVVKHDYVPKTTTKFLGAKQTVYPCKNWSSVMLFNNDRCRALTPEYVNRASGAELHQFMWAKSVGELPKEYNHLVGEYDENPDAKIVHYTLGTPCFKGYEDQEFACDWGDEKMRMLHAD